MERPSPTSFCAKTGSGMRSSGQTTPESGAVKTSVPSFTLAEEIGHDKIDLEFFFARIEIPLRREREAERNRLEFLGHADFGAVSDVVVVLEINLVLVTGNEGPFMRQDERE